MKNKLKYNKIIFKKTIEIQGVNIYYLTVYKSH